MKSDDLKQMYDFSGQTAVITGGGGVLGGEMAASLAWFGANVVILDRCASLNEHILAAAEGAPGKLTLIQSDVLSRDVLQASADEMNRTFGKVDMLINAAGGNHPSATTSADKSFFDLPTEALKFVFDLNLIGTILPCQVFGRQMAEAKRGTILNISSMNAYRPLTRIPAYSGAKAGVSNFTQWLAVHMAQEYSPNIRVNAIAPGFLLGEQNRFLLTDEKTGDLTARGRTILEHTPMNRFGNPEDLLGAVLWLLSPAAAFVTGVVVPIDGGFSAFAGV
ncbi:putative oxidoreductase UxuB [bioreactor metagenome]|uniref:Putative oxidoreductase UxuB n=1 Tax=bioreactor metagenome TaxID=1076179 RepID=A0A644ZU45_9ZZZZ